MDYKQFEPYQILGVNPDASENEIARAFKKLIMVCHPDVHRGEESQANHWTRVLIEARDEMLRRCRAGYPNAGARQAQPGSGPEGGGFPAWIAEFIERMCDYYFSPSLRNMELREYTELLETGYMPAVSTNELMGQIEEMASPIYKYMPDNLLKLKLSYEGIRVHEGGGALYEAHLKAYMKIGEKLSDAIKRAVRLAAERDLEDIELLFLDNLGDLLRWSTVQGNRFMKSELEEKLGGQLFKSGDSTAFCKILLEEMEAYHLLGNPRERQLDWGFQFGCSLPGVGIYDDFRDLVQEKMRCRKGPFKKLRRKWHMRRFERKHPELAKVKL